ncbi:MAG: SIS domain-containing protein [Acidobacteriota bacterium]
MRRTREVGEVKEKPTAATIAQGSPSRAGALEFARQVLRIEARALSGLAERFDEEVFDRALQLLLDCRGRVVCCGMGKSGIIGKKVAGTLASTGSPAFFLHPAEAGHGDLGMVVEGDVVIAISHSGETKEVVAMLPSIKRLAVPLIALVGELDSTLAGEADVALYVGVEEEACPLGLVPTASTTAALAMGDALAMALLLERGFSAEDLAAVHPRGGIGRRLLRVRHVLHTGSELPRIEVSATIEEVVNEISRKGLGMTSVVNEDGRLVGVVTDGDLRRLLGKGARALEGRVSDYMTPGPICVDADALATEALRMLEEKKITSLLVVDEDGRPEGVVHLHDLWRTEMI